MKKTYIYILFCFCFWGHSQKQLSNLLNQYNTESIPYITINELLKYNNNLILLDARELFEYKTSHLKDAIYIGYSNFNLKKTTFLYTILKKKKPIAYMLLTKNGVNG